MATWCRMDIISIRMDFIVSKLNFFKVNLLFFLLLNFLFEKSYTVSFWANHKAHKAYEQKDYDKAKEILEKEQVNNPDNPELNYNLGDIYYKLNKFDIAKSNFQRAIENCSENQKELQEFSYFNLGNSFYKNCLKTLGPDWQKKDFKEQDNKILDLAINELKQATDKYKKALELNDKDEKVKVNLKESEKLLKELEIKLKQEKDKQEKNKKDKEQKQDQEENQQEDQGKKEKQEKQNKDQSEKSAQQEKQDKSEKQQQEKGEENSSQDSEKKEENGQQDKSDGDQTQKEEQDMGNHDNNSQEKQQAGQPEKQDSIKEKGMKVLLDDLAKDESKLQKSLIWQQSKGGKMLDSKQKPW
ncbi:tetratricopeptide repeat protein [Candidatus Babeliales bacterium]|nr:tetratricopeptide repeat protein [Candidatus Babeliales bacterium]MCF7899730.1 tetratricopeptide repeat protein [Candidatus Babeliales bacterium]